MFKVKTKHMICLTSPKKAFYNLLLAGNKVLKVSGVTVPFGEIRDKRVFKFDDNKAAEKFFEKKIKEKVQGNRKRVYVDMETCPGGTSIPLGVYTRTN